MSTNQTLLLIEGDHTKRLEALFACFKYRLVDEKNELVPGGHTVWEKLRYPRPGESRLISHKAVISDGRWTAVLDSGFSFFGNDRECEACARLLGSRMFGYLASGTSGSYGLFQFSPHKIRGLFVQEGSVVENFGHPLPEEGGIVNETLSDEDLFRVVKRLGFDERLFENPESKVLIVALDESLIAAENDARDQDSKRNPWWKFWR